jgi:dUTP pyrophosphatase
VSTLRVRVRLLADVPVPERHTEHAAGYDLRAAEPARIPARGFGLVRTGIAIEMPPGLEAQVRARSGLAANKGIGLLNAPGTIDSDYRGEISVILFNMNSRAFEVRSGDRIAQLVFSRLAAVRLEPARQLSRTKRGPRGFGHTG